MFANIPNNPQGTCAANGHPPVQMTPTGPACYCKLVPSTAWPAFSWPPPATAWPPPMPPTAPPVAPAPAPAVIAAEPVSDQPKKTKKAKPESDDTEPLLTADLKAAA